MAGFYRFTANSNTEERQAPAHIIGKHC